MSRKGITAGIIVSSLCLFLYLIASAAQYFSYMSAFYGSKSLGDLAAHYTLFQIYSPWLIRAAAFFPLFLFFRSILKWSRGAKVWLLIAALLIPWLLSNIAARCYSLCIDTISSAQIQGGILLLTAALLTSFVSNAVSAFFYVAAFYGVGLFRKNAPPQAAPADQPPAKLPSP